MATLHTASTEEIPSSVLSHLRTLLDVVFRKEFTDNDWDHSLGGVHVWVADSHRVISHGSLVERDLLCSGHTLRVGYVEAVATDPSRRHEGHGTKVMKHIGDLIREGYPSGALSTGSLAFYEPLGWEQWRGPTFVDGPNGRERTPDDDGGVMILQTPRSPRLDLDGEMVCRWRQGDVW